MTATPTPRARNPAATLNQLRTVHTWIGMLIAPTVLFMALTGIVQIYNLHEEHPGYTPPPILEKLSALHKDQVTEVHRHGLPPGLARSHAMGPHGGPSFREGPPPEEEHHARLVVILLKAFLTAAALGLIASTLIGVWMALQPGRPRLLNLALVGVGAAIPIALIVWGA